MAAEVKKEIQLEIGPVLFIDVVGYSKLSIDDQHAAIDPIRSDPRFQKLAIGIESENAKQ